MESLKYHMLTASSAVIFSFVSAITVNQFVKYALEDNTYPPAVRRKTGDKNRQKTKPFEYYEKLIHDKGFFKITDEMENTEQDVPEKQSADILDLKLVGTVSGPKSIARALIIKRGEREPLIYSINDSIHGYKLAKIKNSSVYLARDNKTEVIDIYDDRDWKRNSRSRSSRRTGTTRNISKRISRAEIKQKILNNVDNALKGLRAAPYRQGGRVSGYRLIKVRPYNILYKLGMRSGDIIKRINGHIISGTEKLYSLWRSLSDSSQVTVDLERRGNHIHYNFTISQ
ncbi:MAG TPA: hypothetical protein PK926_04455 [Spirochaetota bacterium]|nr:hypothetical protein [Spirochaetota bacterium]HPI87784.1 hypothetical protein [Spirochaetota bacterium]HPR47040.1 hypothetical protein [Spirochaetota bacterium]